MARGIALSIIGCGGVGSNFAEMVARSDLEVRRVSSMGNEYRSQLIQQALAVFLESRGGTKWPIDERHIQFIGGHYQIELERVYLVDGDRVEDKNLERQGFTEDDVGEFKAVALCNRLMKINPFVEFVPVPQFLSDDLDRPLISGMMSGHDVMFLATDSRATKKWLVDRCAYLRRANSGMDAWAYGSWFLANCDGDRYELKNYWDAGEGSAWRNKASSRPTGGYMNVQNGEVNRLVAARALSYFNRFYRFLSPISEKNRFIAWSEVGERMPNGVWTAKRHSKSFGYLKDKSWEHYPIEARGILVNTDGRDARD